MRTNMAAGPPSIQDNHAEPRRMFGNCYSNNKKEAEAQDRMQFNPKKVVRIPKLKRKKDNVPVSEVVKLQRVLGFTVSSNASLDCDPNTGAIVYPAGCVVVVYNPRKNKQSSIVNSSKKTITSLAVSADGKYVVTGECGHLPNVRVWDIQERLQVAEFAGHKFGINCVAFSPNLKYVVSVGSQHDMIVCVWDWRNNTKVASNKVSSKVKAVAFSQGGNYFVTVGNRHVKFWYLEYASRSSKYKEPVPLMGRSAILGEQRNNNFCDVACGLGDMSTSTFAITKSGLLCEFNSRRLLDKWVELRTPSANCLTVGNDFIFIGCAEGIIRCFSPYSLEFVTTLPRTHHLGVDVAQGLSIAHMGSHPSSAKYPDSVAITYDATGRKVTSIYNDHSLYVWDVKDIKKVGKSHSFLYHSACIWGIEMYPAVPSNCQVALPSGSFVTCSSDDTIRIWNLDANMSPTVSYKRNIYSNELLKVMYVDEDLAFLCDTDRNIVSGMDKDKTDGTYDSKNGVRCIRISPDGQHLASGDRSGNIRIHELMYLDEVCKIEAHDAEVLNLEYSRPETGRRLLASASRDRLIHVFDLDQDYAFQQTLDDHSSSITAVRFVNVNQQLQMISCGSDKSVIFRTAQYTPNPQFARDHHVVGKSTLYDMEVDVSQKHVLTACQDRSIRVYNVVSGKQTKTFKGSLAEDGTLIKLALDASGHFLATSCTDKSLCIYDYLSGDCVATMYGHSDIVTGIRFTYDCKHLISVSGDGCIFIWELPIEIAHPMQMRLAQLQTKTRHTVKHSIINNNHSGVSKEAEAPSLVPSSVPPVPSHLENAVPKGFVAARAEMFNPNGEQDPTSPDYRFSVGPLPLWAKKQITEEPTNRATSPKTTSAGANVAQPKGRWAQRIDGQGVAVRSFYSSDQIIPYPNQASRPSSPHLGKASDQIKETIIISKEDIPDNGRFSPCPESLRQIKAGPLGEELTKPLGETADEVLKQKRAQKAKFWEMSVGAVTTRRGDTLPTRPRRYTDTSSVNSLQVEELDDEAEGDAEDEGSETDHSTEISEIIYYPPPEGSVDNDGDFKVCATNPEDLRESHRRMRRGRQDRPSDLPIVNVQQHDSEDDEEPHTPQPTDRNPMSAFSVSMESLDRVGQRERFLKSNFDSLDRTGNGEPGADGIRGAADGVSAHDDEETADKRSSLSARYHGSTPRDSSLKAKLLPEGTSPKKLEIMKQMEKSRRKLNTVGWKAMMNSSKSIGDLTDLPEKDTSGRYLSAKDGMSQANVRRATSMTDLSFKSPARILPNPVQSNVVPNRRQVPNPREPVASQLYRSNSSALLNNNSDSETDNSSDHSLLGKKQGVLAAMRPTISSMNKAVQGSPTGNVRQRLADRKNRTYSHRGDEEPGAAARTMTLPRSPRSALGASFSKSERDLSRLGETSPAGRLRSNNAHSSVMDLNSKRDSAAAAAATSRARIFSNHLEKSPQELPVKDDRTEVISMADATLTPELCASASESLRLAADNVLQLYKRVTLDSDLGEEEKASCLSALVESATQAQQTLKPIPGVGHVPPSLVSLDSKVNVANLDGVGGANNPETMLLLQQYSDKLLSVLQQRITSQNT